jgi:hypothetical protein
MTAYFRRPPTGLQKLGGLPGGSIPPAGDYCIQGILGFASPDNTKRRISRKVATLLNCPTAQSPIFQPEGT